MNIGEAIKELRMELALDKSELARKIEIHPTTLNNYELGLRKPRFYVLRKIKKVAAENDIQFDIKEYIS